MPHDYRYDPFSDVSEAIAITGETHVIPSVSPYTIRLNEVPMKDTPSSISLTIDGVSASEVSAAPAAGEFWPDYSTKADSDDSWNTGTMLFNAADAGKTIVVSYVGTGTLVDIAKTREVHGRDIFTESGLWTCPDGVTLVNSLLFGAGAGGSGYPAAGGGNGGDSSFGTLLSAAGGKKGVKSTTPVSSGEITTSLDFACFKIAPMMGDPGAAGVATGNGGNATGFGNSGGNSATSGNIACAGGRANEDGIAGTSTSVSGASGGGCVYAIGVPVVPGTEYIVTIGAGGEGGGSTVKGGDGVPGLCIIWY